MAGLLGDVLPWMYSQSNTIKKNVKGLLNDPAAFIGSLGQDIQTQNDQRKADYRTLMEPGVFTSEAEKSAAINRAAQEAVNYAAPTVWHGSPHKFDKFDSSKIGTGEGAQAYAHGLYFAEKPEVAKEYQKALSAQLSADGKPLLSKNKIVGTTGNKDVDDVLMAYDGDVDFAISQVKEWRKDVANNPKQAALYDKQLAALENLRGKVKFDTSGHLYKVDLPDSAVAKMLDWDKPLSQQAPEVQKAIKSTATYADKLAGHKAGRLRNPDETTGSQWMSFLQDEASLRAAGTGQPLESAGLRKFPASEGANPNTRAEMFLSQAGIPGIRYLDQGSRFTPQAHIEFGSHLDGSPRFSVNGPKGDMHFGTMKEAQDYIESLRTRNYVVFPGEEGLLNILERNGQPVAKQGGLLNGFPARTADTMSDAIAIDSPNGRMSKRAKEAATKRLGEALFGPGGATREQIMGGPTPQPSASEALLRQAARLRDLAARGMSVKKFTKEAEKLEAQAAALK